MSSVKLPTNTTQLMMDQCGQQSRLLETNKPNGATCPQIEAPTPMNEQPEANLTARHRTAFPPLPNEVLRYIFVLIAEECGPVTLPFFKGGIPIQLILSHVCSRWRVVARYTFELWNNICLIGNLDGNYYTGQSLQEWVQLAGNSTVALSLDWPGSIVFADDNQIANIIQNTISPFKAKVLILDITIGQLMALLRLPCSVLPDIRGLRLTLTDNDIFSISPHIFVRLQLVTLFKLSAVENPEASVEHFPLPWSQLQCLKICFYIDHLTPVFAILEQIPALQSLYLAISLYRDRPLDSLGKLTMPSLRTLALVVEEEDFDMILPHFTCPALTNLALFGSALWTDATFEILRQQYNVERLHEIQFEECPLPVSSILKAAPLLGELYLIQDATTMDDDAVTGISNGTLGRHLRKLLINATGIVDVILEMVEMRKRMSDMLIANGCHWREAITRLTEIEIQVDGKWQYINTADE